MKNFLSQLASRLAGRPASPAPSNSPATQRATPPPFEPANDLERHLVGAVRDAAQRPEFQRLLLASDLFAATPAALVEGEARAETAELSLLNVPGPDGKPIAAVFTSQARATERFGPGVGVTRMKGEALLGAVANTGAILNPGLGYSVHWGPNDIAALLGRSVPRTLAKATQLLLGSPKEPPEELIADLRRVLGSDDRMAAAWLALANWPDGKAGWYLDVRTEASQDDVRAMLAETFKRTNFRGLPLDMVVNKPGGKDGVGIRVAPQTH